MKVTSVTNVMEKMAWDLVDTIIDQTDAVCNCEQCKNDIVALALNNIKPRYSTSEKGQAIIKAMALDPQSYSDVVKALTQAIELVGKNPRHE